jgi:hypothetical protein
MVQESGEMSNPPREKLYHQGEQQHLHPPSILPLVIDPHVGTDGDVRALT